MILLQLQFSCVFDGHDTLIVLDEAAERIEQCCLTRTGTTADDHVQSGLDAPLEQHHHFRSKGLVVEQVF